MASNLTIESPNFEKINKEAGQHTRDAISLLWAALNDTRKQERIDFRRAKDMLAPKVLTIAASASVNDLDLQDCSIVLFTSGTQNFTGMRAPDTGTSRIVFVYNAGAGTITAKQAATSEAANQLLHESGADVSLTTNLGTTYVYLSGKWREFS